jgi:hypothetical protein
MACAGADRLERIILLTCLRGRWGKGGESGRGEHAPRRYLVSGTVGGGSVGEEGGWSQLGAGGLARTESWRSAEAAMMSRRISGGSAASVGDGRPSANASILKRCAAQSTLSARLQA